MNEGINKAVEKRQDILEDIASGKCKVEYVSTDMKDDPIYKGYKAQVYEMELKYPNPNGKNGDRLVGYLFIYCTQGLNRGPLADKKIPGLRIKIIDINDRPFELDKNKDKEILKPIFEKIKEQTNINLIP